MYYNTPHHDLGSSIYVYLDGKAKKYQKEFETFATYIIQDEVINGANFWQYVTKKKCIWYANGAWRVGKAEDLGTQKCALCAPGMKDELPGDLRGQWSYWNPDKNEWVKERDYIVKVRWWHDPVYI